jgi:hypothetical protein
MSALAAAIMNPKMKIEAALMCFHEVKVAKLPEFRQYGSD